MKIILILVLVCLCSYVGFGFGKYYKKRKVFFQEFVLLLESLNLDISFSREKIHVILTQKNFKSSSLNKLIENYVNLLQKEGFDEKELFENVKILKEDEMNLIYNFFKMLGRFNVDLQTKQIQEHKQKILIVSKQCDEEEKKYSPLFLKLGIMFGALLGLIFV